MFLSKLALLQFKNHPQREFQFSRKINCLIGNNGIGKTNVLDAIYYLCLTKSYFGHNDQQNILFGKDFFRIDATLVRDQTKHTITYKFQNSRKKELLVNEVPVPKFSTHVGQYPVVMIAPDDNALVTGGSEERRKFLDSTISQVQMKYLENLMQYNQFLSQRNAALKEFAEHNTLDKALLETYNHKLHVLGTEIFEARSLVIERLQPIFSYYYETLSLQREKVSFQYASQLRDTPLESLLEKNLKRDLILQRTESGIHKDDIEFFIDSNKIKRFGSQGQQKSFVVAMKMAQYQFIRAAKGFRPFLLIDDIFDKLDPDRSRELLNIIAGDDFGQVFLSDTDSTVIETALRENPKIYEILNI
ncbi:MAG: DNA replication and repair protein RecF [Bacteroidetes bacterium]|nr:DNA replication and repair protein RecF [Bacteroidota bacterium]